MSFSKNALYNSANAARLQIVAHRRDFDAESAASGSRNVAVLWNVAPSAIHRANLTNDPLPRRTRPSMTNPRAAAWRVYPIATTIIRYGTATVRASHGRGWL